MQVVAIFQNGRLPHRLAVEKCSVAALEVLNEVDAFSKQDAGVMPADGQGIETRSLNPAVDPAPYIPQPVENGGPPQDPWWRRE